MTKREQRLKDLTNNINPEELIRVTMVWSDTEAGIVDLDGVKMTLEKYQARWDPNELTINWPEEGG